MKPLIAISAVRSIQNWGRNVYGWIHVSATISDWGIANKSFVHHLLCISFDVQNEVSHDMSTFCFINLQIIVIKIIILISLLVPKTTLLFGTFVPLGKFCFVCLCIVYYVLCSAVLLSYKIWGYFIRKADVIS